MSDVMSHRSPNGVESVTSCSTSIYGSRTIQELLGHKDVATTAALAHPCARGIGTSMCGTYLYPRAQPRRAGRVEPAGSLRVGLCRWQPRAYRMSCMWERTLCARDFLRSCANARGSISFRAFAHRVRSYTRCRASVGPARAEHHQHFLRATDAFGGARQIHRDFQLVLAVEFVDAW